MAGLHAHARRATAEHSALLALQAYDPRHFRKMAAFVYLRPRRPGVWALVAAQLDSCRARDQTRRWRTFFNGIFDARVAFDGAGALRTRARMPGPVARDGALPAPLRMVVRRLLELSAQSSPEERHPRAQWPWAALTAACGRSHAHFTALRWLRRSHDAWSGRKSGRILCAL